MTDRNTDERVSRLVMFGRGDHDGQPCRIVRDILEVSCRPRLSEFKRALTKFNEHNPCLHLRRREEFRQMRTGEMEFAIEVVK